MTVRDWLGNVADYHSRYPPTNAARASALTFWNGVCRNLGKRVPNAGREIWTREWDVLVILDACRPDALETVADDYPFLPSEVPTHPSRGSWSREWLRENFSHDHRDELADVAMVSGNVYTSAFHDAPDEGFADPDWFAALDEVWRDGWDERHGTVHPETVRDRAISLWRHRERYGADRMVVHFMQPHVPFRSLDITGHRDPDAAGEVRRRTVWDEVQAGVLSTERARAAYRDNLRWALNHVSTLLRNLETDSVVLSADHGELFGEHGLYSHPDVPHPALRTVPWVETTACDDRTVTPGSEPEPAGPTGGDDVEQRLNALGYL